MTNNKKPPSKKNEAGNDYDSISSRLMRKIKSKSSLLGKDLSNDPGDSEHPGTNEDDNASQSGSSKRGGSSKKSTSEKTEAQKNQDGSKEKYYDDEVSASKTSSQDDEQADVEYMSPVMASHVRQPKKWSTVLIYSIAAFFVCAFIWANLANLDEITRGEGRVIPTGQIKKIDHLEGGIVKDILVKEGEIVDKDQVLLLIDSTVAKARYEEGLSLYYQTLAQITRLKAQLADEQFIVPDEVEKNVPEIAAKERDTYKASVSRLRNEKEIAKREIEQREQESIEAKTKLEQLKNRLLLAEEELKMTEPLVKSGIAPKVDWIRIKRDINDTKGELESAKANIPRAEAAYLQTKQKLEQVEVNFRTDWYKELQEAERRWAEVKDATTTGLDRLNRTEIKSPVRGTIKELKVNTIGSVVQPGEDLIDIVPLEDKLLIEAQVRPSDVAFLRPGMRAVVKITAYDFSIYGGLEATLVDISADTISEEKQNLREGEKEFFRVRLRTEKNHLGTDKNPLPISPGMTAQVDILTGKKSVWQYLLKPVLRAKENALTER